MNGPKVQFEAFPQIFINYNENWVIFAMEKPDGYKFKMNITNNGTCEKHGEPDRMQAEENTVTSVFLRCTCYIHGRGI